MTFCIIESGGKRELTGHGLRRVGQAQVDADHQWMDQVIVAVPWVLRAWLSVQGPRRTFRFLA